MEIVAHRTRLRPGAAERYAQVHSRIPDAVAAALRECGVVSWRIWRDGDVLFHTIETTTGFDAMLSGMRRRGPIDPDWDALIDSLVDDSRDSSAVLDHVWTMDTAGQSGG